MMNDDSKSDVARRTPVDGAKDSGGMVEQLLQAAGPGPEIPNGGAERVKSLIRPVWREGVAARTRQYSRLWLGGLATAAALVIALVSLPFFHRSTPVPLQRAVHVALIEGALEVTPPGSHVGILTAEDTRAEIPRGSLIRTGAESRAAIWLADQRSLRLDVDTELRLDSEASISLESGAIYIDSQNRSSSGVEIRTAFGTATEIGTQFEVRLEDSAVNVTVREGLVSLMHADEEHQITQGISLSLKADGSVHTGTITAYDPSWWWIQEIAPVFEIEGQTVLAFLDWVSSETGLSVSFANTETEQFAATTILHGSIEGLSPNEAPNAILPSCRLAATVDSGTLQIRRLTLDGEGP